MSDSDGSVTRFGGASKWAESGAAGLGRFGHLPRKAFAKGGAPPPLPGQDVQDGPGRQVSDSPLHPARRPELWSVSEVGRWLHVAGFGTLASRFAEQDVDGEVLLALTSEELRGQEMALSLGMAKKLLNAIALLSADEELGDGLQCSPSGVRTPKLASPPTADTLDRSPEPRLVLDTRRLGVSPSKSGLDTLSLVGSAAPSVQPSPFYGHAASRPDMTPPLASAVAAMSPDHISVRVLNGVSGEEEVRFALRHQASHTGPQFLSSLDALCQQHAGQALSGLNWLSQAQPGDRFQRRKCDVSMFEELMGGSGSTHKVPSVLLLCTVPQRPPSELTASKVRLKNLIPCRVALGCTEPMRLRLDTSLLQGGHEYTVAFTHQWTSMTYTSPATLLPGLRGVELIAPRQLVSSAGPEGARDGLYDVHLVIDSAVRSENRRTLTVGSAESEMSSSSTRSLSTSSFVPIGRSGSKS
uniref:SAM domain-containing protein n=1 Tax=Zooxanthella nutricula TaxID=1333877 RepID=A0A7S2ICN0_9DINO